MLKGSGKKEKKRKRGGGGGGRGSRTILPSPGGPALKLVVYLVAMTAFLVRLGSMMRELGGLKVFSPISSLFPRFFIHSPIQLRQTSVLELCCDRINKTHTSQTPRIDNYWPYQ